MNIISVVHQYFNWKITKDFFSNLYQYHPTKVFLSLVTLFGICYAMTRETFLQNGNSPLLPFQTLFSLSNNTYELEANIDSTKIASNYIFVLDRSYSVNNPKIKIKTAPAWYLNTIKEFKIVTGRGSLKFPEENLSNFDIIKMKLIQFILLLKAQENRKINIAIWTIGDNSDKIYPIIPEKIIGDELSSALLTVYAATIGNDGYKNTDFLQLFNQISSTYYTKDPYKNYHAPEYVLVILSDLIHDVDEHLNKIFGKNEDAKELEIKKQQAELYQLIGSVSIQNLVANAIVLKNFYTNKTKKYRFSVVSILDSCFINYQLSKYDIDSPFLMNYNIILEDLKFYYENPYKKTQGIKKILGFNRKGSLEIALISLLSVTREMVMDYKVVNLTKPKDSIKRGRMILGNNYQVLNNMSSSEALLLQFSERELPDINNTQAAIYIRYLESGLCNFIIPISFVRILSNRSAIILSFLEICVILSLLLIVLNMWKLTIDEYQIGETAKSILKPPPLLVLKIICTILLIVTLLTVFRVL